MDVPAAPRRGPSGLRIIKAGRVEFSKNGYAGTSLAVIAEAAGLRKPSIFAHFATKDALYVAVLEDCLRDLMAMFAAAESEGSTPESMVAAIEQACAEDNFAGARVLIRELFDERAPTVNVRGRFQVVLTSMCKRWPSMDPHLAMSFIGMHMFHCGTSAELPQTSALRARMFAPSA